MLLNETFSFPLYIKNLNLCSRQPYTDLMTVMFFTILPNMNQHNPTRHEIDEILYSTSTNIRLELEQHIVFSLLFSFLRKRTMPMRINRSNSFIHLPDKEYK